MNDHTDEVKSEASYNAVSRARQVRMANVTIATYDRADAGILMHFGRLLQRIIKLLKTDKLTKFRTANLAHIFA